MEVDIPQRDSYSNDDFIFELLKSGNREGEEDCSSLVDTIWLIYSCTPLNNFSYGENDLKTYERKISKILQTELSVVSPKCTIEMEPSLAFTSRDNPAIKITVHSGGSNKKKLLYSSFLVSRDSPLRSESFVRLPVLLCKGSKQTSAAVHSAIESLFDASISEVKLSVNELLALSLCHCIKTNVEEEEALLILKYQLLEDQSLSIDYSIVVDDFKELWTRMLKKSQVDDCDLILSFYKDLLFQFRHNFEMDLNFFNLSTISIADTFKIDKKGKIKCKQSSVFDILLKYLTRKINNDNLV